MTSKAERRENARLLADALLEAFERKYDEALASAADIELSDTSPISFERIYARIRSQRRRRTVMLVAAVLAALMLCGCTAYVYREQLASFLLEHTHLRTKISTQISYKELPDVIPRYNLSFIPNGYKLTEDNSAYLLLNSTWKNDVGQSIIFYQKLPNKASAVNNKGTEQYIIMHNGKEILYVEANESGHFYTWKHGSYTLAILTNEKFTDDEITRMIDSLVITECVSKP